MLEKVKKYGIIAIIAILFTAFSFSIVDVIVQPPEYQDYCSMYDNMYPLKQESTKCTEIAYADSSFEKSCTSEGGRVVYDYDPYGCPTGFECSTCDREFNDAGKQHRLIGFIITGIIGVAAILVGMYTRSKNDVVEWIYSGLLIGGILSIFIGTMSYFHDMGRFVKPFILLAEMGLITWIAIRTSSRRKK